MLLYGLLCCDSNVRLAANLRSNNDLSCHFAFVVVFSAYRVFYDVIGIFKYRCLNLPVYHRTG